MAFVKSELSVLLSANGFTLWHYRTPDLSTDVDTTGYFNEAIANFSVGDFIMANTATGGTVASGVYIVKENNGTDIDVSNISSFGLGDTD